MMNWYWWKKTDLRHKTRKPGFFMSIRHCTALYYHIQLVACSELLKISGHCLFGLPSYKQRFQELLEIRSSWENMKERKVSKKSWRKQLCLCVRQQTISWLMQMHSSFNLFRCTWMSNWHTTKATNSSISPHRTPDHPFFGYCGAY